MEPENLPRLPGVAERISLLVPGDARRLRRSGRMGAG
jgi:hypothetical protein